MRALFIFVILFSGIVFCLGQNHGTACKNKGHHHHDHKLFYLHHLYILAFFALKVKVILVVGSIWGITIMMGKIIGAFKLAEYMKKDSRSQVIYSAPPIDYHHGHQDKSFNSLPFYSSPHGEFSDTPSRIFNKPPTNKYTKYADSYKTLPLGNGRSYFSTDNTPLENLKIFFNTIKRLNITEIVFREMKVETIPCKKKFVCEADFNVKQSVIVKTVFNLFLDDCYKKYRCKEPISSIDECAKLNPTCPDKVIQPLTDT